MKCEFNILKSELPDSNPLLYSFIDNTYNVKISKQDLIFLIDAEGDKFLLNEQNGNLQDLKSFLPGRRFNR